jgi:hypothetical protein
MLHFPVQVLRVLPSSTVRAFYCFVRMIRAALQINSLCYVTGTAGYWVAVFAAVRVSITTQITLGNANLENVLAYEGM